MTDNVPYTVAGKAGDVEFRKYPAMILAPVSSGPDEEMIPSKYRMCHSSRDTITIVWGKFRFNF